MEDIDERLRILLNNFTLNVLVDVSQGDKKDYQAVFRDQLIPAIKRICGVEDTELPLINRKENFRLALIEFKDKYPAPELQSFYNYWTEESGGKVKKMRYEKQPTWSLAGRLALWHKNQTKFSIAKLINKGGSGGR